jgi:uncharacterized sulfatase
VNRRNFVKAAGAGALSGAQGAGLQPAAGPARQVVFLMTDTTRWDMLNCYRKTGLQTPNLDRLASQGVRFERAYSCQPVCGPARSALFTGAWPHTNGVWGNSMALGTVWKTIGQRLQDRGAHTAYIGKWHLDGADYFGTGRCPEGWDKGYWFDGRSYLQELPEKDRVRSRTTATNQEPALREDFLFAHRCSNRAIDFLSKHNAERFFLVVSYDEPHGPFLCPRPYSEMYRGFEFPSSRNLQDSLANKPEHQRVWAGPQYSERPAARPLRQPGYFGCHTYVDYEIGRVLDAIDKYSPNALVIYTSDHGDFLASHQLSGKGPAAYDEIARIPFLVRWPGRSPKGATCAHPVSHIDVVPTILDAMGVPVAKPLEGKSMLASFLNPQVRPNEAIFMEWGRYEVDHDGFGGFQPLRTAFDGRYKLTVNLLTTDELYDLETDPGEMINLIGSSEHAAIRNALHDRMIEWMHRTRDPFRGYYWGRRPWRPDYAVSWAGLGMTRQREDDGYEPRQLVYETGLEMKEAVRKK